MPGNNNTNGNNVKLLTLVIVALLSYSVVAKPLEALTFIAFGDLPYSQKEALLLTHPDGAIAKAVKQQSPPFVIHYGDFKPGDLDCSDEVLLQRRQLLAQLYPKRLVYTPGDNEWTDCDREYVPTPQDELERLDKLRSLFFAGEGLALSAQIPGLKRQPQMPENAIWQAKGVLFGTIHLPGSNNGRETIFRSDETKALDMADWRDQQNRIWLVELFKRAQRNEVKALVVTFQADIFRPSESGKNLACDDKRRTECNGFKTTRDFLELAATHVDIPVLLIHGDTSSFCFEQPNQKLAPNLWRLNGPGDYKVIDGVSITVDSQNLEKPFSVTTLLSKQQPPKVCEYKKQAIKKIAEGR